MQRLRLLKVQNPNMCRTCPFLAEVVIAMPKTTQLERGYTCLRRDCDNHIDENRTIQVHRVRLVDSSNT